jgi:hypothetical protein
MGHSGHVFHPGHHELHGITVVVETTTGEAYVGRFDSQDAEGVHLLDVAVHPAGSDGSPLADFVARTLRFGVRSDRKHLLVPPGAVSRVTRLTEWSA